MIDYFFLIFCFLSVFNLKIKGIDDFFFDYMGLENANSIKGIFVWLIIFHHKSVYGIKKNYIYLNITRNLGQKIVSMFLFYSGFGIYESLKTKGENYPRSLLTKAFNLFIKSQIILIIYLIANIFIFKYKITLKIYFLSVIFKSSLGNSNWFAFTIIILYSYSYLSFRFVKNQIFIGIIIISIICFLHVKLVYNFYYPKKIYSVDTVLCFVFGFYYSLLKKYIDRILMKNDIQYFLFVSITIFLFYKILLIQNLICISITNSLFSVIIIFISMKMKFNNELLKFLNFHSYSIYLLQRLVLWIVYKKQIFINSSFIQISFEFTSIFFIATLFDKYTAFIDKFFKRISNKNKSNIYIPINNIIFHDATNS